MNWSNVKELTIPEGLVAEIKINGVTVWKSESGPGPEPGDSGYYRIDMGPFTQAAVANSSIQFNNKQLKIPVNVEDHWEHYYEELQTSTIIIMLYASRTTKLPVLKINGSEITPTTTSGAMRRWNLRIAGMGREPNPSVSIKVTEQFERPTYYSVCEITCPEGWIVKM